MDKRLDRLIDRVIGEDVDRIGDWFRMRKLWFYIGLEVVVLIALYYGGYPSMVYLVSNIRDTLIVSSGLIVACLIVISYRKEKRRNIEDTLFTENFSRGLNNWDYQGSIWETDYTSKGHFLRISSSYAAGIAKRCRTWENYIFEFDTRIVKDSTIWIIRARDVVNFVAIKCSETELVPFAMVNGMYFEMRKFPRIQVKTAPSLWFNVQIEVSNYDVTMRIDGTELYWSGILKPTTTFINTSDFLDGEQKEKYKDQFTPVPVLYSVPFGSVGFLAYEGNEAHFKNVKVTKALPRLSRA